MQCALKPLKRILLLGALSFGSSVYGQTILTMDRATEIARENSPALRRSYLNLERYEQTLIAQRASLKSKFSLNLDPIDYTKNRRFDNRLSQWYTNETFSSSGTFQIDQPILWTDGVLSLINRFGWQNNNSDIYGERNSNQAFSNDLYLQFTQPLFTYNRRKEALKEIEFQYENARISYALQRLETERQITSQFYTVYMAQNDLDISREELANAEQNYAVINDKVDAELEARGELYQAELNRATARSAVENRAVALENAKDALKQLLGMPLGEEIRVVAEVQIEPVEVNLEQAVRNGLNTRLELRRREIEMDQLDLEMVRTKASNEFKGDMTLSFGLIGDNHRFDRVYDNPTQNPRIAISFTVPIFDWGEKKAKVKAQQTARRISELEFKEEKIDIEQNIRKTWRSLLNLRSQISIAEKSVLNAQRTYDLNQIRYREGEISGMEMNQFQTQLSNEKTAYTQQLIHYKIELLNMKILSLYDFEKKAALVPMSDLTNRSLK